MSQHHREAYLEYLKRIAMGFPDSWAKDTHEIALADAATFLSVKFNDAGIRATQSPTDAFNASVTDEKLVAKAVSGDAGARAALFIRSYFLLRSIEASALSSYVGNFLLEQGLKKLPSPRGRPASDKTRDLQIANAVQRVCEHGFKPTRNSTLRGGASRSACSIVVEALALNQVHMSEDAVVKIWQRWKKDGKPYVVG